MICFVVFLFVRVCFLCVSNSLCVMFVIDCVMVYGLHLCVLLFRACECACVLFAYHVIVCLCILLCDVAFVCCLCLCFFV